MAQKKSSELKHGLTPHQEIFLFDKTFINQHDAQYLYIKDCQMTFTMLMLPLFILPLLALFLHWRKQKKLQGALHAEMEAQKKALRLLGNAAIAMESGDKEGSKQLLDEANALLKKRPG